jgi:hypothetical protein
MTKLMCYEESCRRAAFGWFSYGALRGVSSGSVLLCLGGLVLFKFRVTLSCQLRTGTDKRNPTV